jgi:TolA-binding protein
MLRVTKALMVASLASSAWLQSYGRVAVFWLRGWRREMLRLRVCSRHGWRRWQRAAIGCLLLLLENGSLLLASPTEEEAYRALEQRVTSGAQAQTVREAQTFLRRFPQSAQRPQVLFWSAEAFYATQAYRDALTAYQSLLREAPKSPYTATTLHRLGLSYVYSRAVEAALRTITQLLAQFPGDKETDQIIFLMATSHFEQSQEVLQVRYQLGTIALVQKQYDSAQQHYRAVAQAASGPLVVQAHYALAWLFVHQGQIAQAVAYLRRQGLLAQPTTTDTALAQGYDLLLLQHYEEAIPLLTNAAATWQYEASSAEWKALLLLEPPGPRRGEVLWRLGRDLLALKQYREARDHLL